MVTERFGFEGRERALERVLEERVLPVILSANPSSVHIPRGFEHIPSHFFEGEPRLAEVIEDLDLVPVHCNADGTYLIMTPNSPPAQDVSYTPEICYKYVVQPAGVRQHGHEQLLLLSPIDPDWQRIMLRGLANQRRLEDITSLQHVISTEFVWGIPGLVQLEYVQGETWEQRYNLDKPSDLVGSGQYTSFVSLHVDAILKDAKSVYDRIVQPMLKRGYVHRDFNPANIVFRKGDDAPIAIDLSLCADRKQYQEDVDEGRLLGTLIYLSHEQPAPFEDLDTYALGMSVLRLAFPYASNWALWEHRDMYSTLLEPHLSFRDQAFMEMLFAHSELEDTLEIPKLTLPVYAQSPQHAPVRGPVWEHEPTADHTPEINLS